MRSIDEISELSYESFIETYGKVNGNYYRPKEARNNSADAALELPKIHVTTTSDDDGKEQESSKMENFEWSNSENDTRKSSFGVISTASSYDSGSDSQSSKNLRSNKLMKKQKLRKISFEKLTALSGAIQAAVSSRRPKSYSFSDKSGIAKPKKDRKASALAPSPSPLSSRKESFESSSISTEEEEVKLRKRDPKSRARERPYTFCAPASPIMSFSHKGYLECRNKKKNWEKYWCVLRDARLHRYDIERPDVIRDVISVRGYHVIADVTDLNRSRFIIRLQQPQAFQGFPTLHFSSNKYRDFLLWVGSLEKETKVLPSSDLSPPDEHATTTASSNGTSLPYAKNNESPSQIDSELFTLQKRKLLKELALQKEQILEEQTLLEKLAQLNSSWNVKPNKFSKEQILDRYEKERIRQELKTTELLTILNTRRNSCRLKMMQYSKDLAPSSAQKNREGDQVILAIEKKLKETEEALLRIDRELEEEEASKLHNIERLQRKRDLELLIAEQHETIDIIRRTKNDPNRFQYVDASMTPSSTRSRDTLESVEEWSDDMVTSSTHGSARDKREIFRQDALCSSSSSSDFSTPSVPVLHSEIFPNSETAFKQECYSDDVDFFGQCESSGEDSGFQPSGSMKIDDSYEFYHSVIKNFFPLSGRTISNFEVDDIEEPVESSPGHMSRESTLKAPQERVNKDNIDSEVLAKIEDFEMFAKMKLKENSQS